MDLKDVKNEHICVITRNKDSFKYICKIFKKAQYKFVDSANKNNCLDGASGQRCVLKIIAMVEPDKKERFDSWPIIVIGGSQNLEINEKSIKASVFDFIERLVGKRKMAAAANKTRNEMAEFDKYKKLTKTEKDILYRIMEGKSNKQIAHTLHRSIRTIEDHRNHIMCKLQADNLVDLVKKCLISTTPQKLGA